MIIFAIKSAITLAVLYSCFFLLLSRETFHRFNRWMLIGMMVASLVVPFIHTTTEHPTAINNTIYKATQEMQDVYPAEPNVTGFIDANVFTGYNWESMLILVYLIGFVVMTVFTIVQLVMIARNIRGGLRHTDSDGNTVILKPGKFAPYSFFHYIVMSVDDYEHNRLAILTHEQEHIRLLHSWDNLFVSLMKILQWFNPFIYLLSRDLDAVHEFEADEAVINNGIDAKTYQQLLVVKATGMRLQTLVNGLNRSSLKKRIIMMYQKKSNRWLMLKAAFALPVLVITIGAFATPAISESIDQVLENIDNQEKQMTQRMQSSIDEISNTIDDEGNSTDETPQIDDDIAVDTCFAAKEKTALINIHPAVPTLAPLIEKIYDKYSTAKSESYDMNDGTCTSTYLFLIPSSEALQLITDIRAAFATDGTNVKTYQYYFPQSGKKTVAVPYKDKMYVLRDNDNLETHVVIANLPQPEYSDKSLCVSLSWNNEQKGGYLEGKVRVLLNKKFDNVLFINEVESDFKEETFKKMYDKVFKKNEGGVAKEDESNISDDVNDMLNVMDICPDDKAKLRGLYSLYFAAIAEAEDLEKKYAESNNGVYQFRDQAKAKRKYAQKIMKKIEKAISEL